MKINQICLFLLVLSAFLACKQNASDATKTTAPTFVQAKSNAIVLKGKIGDEAATMHLIQTPNPLGAGPDFYFGSYFLDKEERPIELSGAIDSAGLLRLEMFDRNDEAAFFLGKIAVDFSTFEGTFSAQKGSKKGAFGLKRADGAVAFSVEIFADSLKSDPKIKDAALSFVNQTWLWPKAADAATTAFLETEIRKNMLGDSLSKTVSGGAAAGFEAYKKYHFSDYPAEVAEWKKDKNEMDSPGLMRDNSSNMDVFYNQNGLLTLGFGESNYSGGAHGMHATTVVTYDLAAKKALKIGDIFNAGYEKTLAAALDKNARLQLGIEPKQTLDEVLFEKTVALNENFGLTSKGIFFDYAPYEIASYAAGEIQIFVPFEDLKDVLKKR